MRPLALAAVLLVSGCSKKGGAVMDPAWREKPGVYAVLATGKGEIVARLYEDKTPKTVANFVGLATGAKDYVDFRDGKKKRSRFYDGLTFMRVMPGFMIQGGDPKNDTTGDPGYSFEDEFPEDLYFDRPGLLAMANSGPNSNGCQFFITDEPRNGVGLPTHLNKKHTIFGAVVMGLDVVSAIADVPAKDQMAVEPVKIEKVDIVRVEPKK